MTLSKYGLFAERLYEKVKQEIMVSDLFTFDWFIKTRSLHDLSKRSNTLLTLITREYESPDALKKKRNRSQAKEETPTAQNGMGALMNEQADGAANKKLKPDSLEQRS